MTSLGAAIGEVLGVRIAQEAGGGAARANGSRPRVLLGHDGRRSGPELEAALARGLLHAGFDSTSAGLITTPGLALLTRTGQFVLGAMVSASHNPAEDNGIKVFSGEGDKLSDEIELAIEARLRARPELEVPGNGPKLEPALEERYLELLLAGPGAGLRLDGLVIALDCAHGGGSRIAPRVFGRLGAQVISIAAEPDGDNINRGVGATHMETLVAAVRAHKPDLGIALDGDGDRCLLVDERGEVVHGDGILTLLAVDAMRKKAWKDPRLVATVMSNKGLHKALRNVGVGVVTTDVGDRRVVEALKREGLRLGGEQSGHIVFGPDHHYIGDGIYTALRVLRVLRDARRPLSELAAAYRPFPQVLVNVNVARKPALLDIPSIAHARALFESELGEDGRILLRYSGTEPLARVMVEGPDAERIREQAQALADLITAEIGA
ncbi:MAG: phosphoglucosamine mutase [Planctomycetes bacterium]|nr:phosphoglucosamine mutase [Planctomycetota bacterium]